MERAAREFVDENGVTLYHHNIDPTENGFWVEAKDLRIGDVFLGANGELTTVVAIERVDYPDGIMVYNFSVDGNHNYFVIAEGDEYGQTSILVHNASVILRELARLGLSFLFPNTAPEDIVIERANTLINMIRDAWRDTRTFIAEIEGRRGPALQQVPPQQVQPSPQWLQDQWANAFNQGWQYWQPGQLPTDQMMLQWVDALQRCEQWW